jgi:hypothetical protein
LGADELKGNEMIAKSFDASKYLTDLRGRDYLEVKWRLLWLRTEHPEANIQTELVKHEESLALFRAHVMIPNGGEATGWGSETASDFHDYIEKAETKALGRALAALGYGTQFCEDFDFSAERNGLRERRHGADQRGGRSKGETTRVVDSPVSKRSLNVIRDGSSSGATESQVKAIYAIGREAALPRPDVDAQCREAYGRAPVELSKQQASEYIDTLRRALPSQPAVAAHA